MADIVKANASKEITLQKSAGLESDVADIMATHPLHKVDNSALIEELIKLITVEGNRLLDGESVPSDSTVGVESRNADRIGELLIKEGWVHQDDIQKAVQEQNMGDPRHIGEILVEQGAIRPQQVIEALNRQKEIRLLKGLYIEAQASLQEKEMLLKELQRAKENAEAANRAKSEFLANMSHELRTPMNAIIGFSELLEDQVFGKLNDKQKRYVDHILKGGRHLLQLINDLLDLSKIEAGRMELHLSSFDVTDAISDAVNIIKPLADKKRIALNVSVESDLPILIADETKFKQILYNLLSNAIKFTPDAGNVKITAISISKPAAIEVSVSDTGIGINPEDQRRIFNVFEQVDASYSRHQQGTGLGLTLTRQLVQMQGGRIWVESEGEGKGSTFTFIIPLSNKIETRHTGMQRGPLRDKIINAR
ncbi:hypothetical protein IH992_02025 [Candidatus Poribacteria bacterium]|nr:hypothetical protein [Candidatus Poribacteria bacterium]